MIIKYDFLSKISGETSEVEVNDELGKVIEQIEVIPLIHSHSKPL